MRDRDELEQLKAENARLREKLTEARRQGEFLLGAIDALPNPIFIKDSEGKFVYFNRIYAAFFGMEREDYLGKSVLELGFLPEEDRKRYQEEDLRLIRDADLLHYEKDYTSAKGKVCPAFYWSSGFAVPGTGEKGLVGEIVDISKERELAKRLQSNVKELERANAVIAAASKIDMLTGVFNRGFLEEQDKVFLSWTRERTVPVGFLMLDLDHFKAVNDTFGHRAGDQVLADFAKLVRGCCRQNDLIFRYGGEEFVVFLYGAEPDTARTVAERIRETCARELKRPDGAAITVSVGVACYHPGEKLDRCIEMADAALYRAKETGRNKVVTEDEL